jgi:small-conductance mechanosensitive channel
MLATHAFAALVVGIAALCAATAQAAESTPVRDRAEVRIANRPIITLHGPVAGHSARERADATVARIGQAIEGASDATVAANAVADGTEVLVNGRRAFVVTRADIDPEAGETTENVARASVERLQAALAEHVEQHTPRYIALATLWTLLATALYLGVVRAVFAIDRLATAWLARLAAARADRIRVKGARLIDADLLARLAGHAVGVATWLLALLATLAWLTFSLTRFAYTRPWGERMGSAVAAKVGEIVIGIVDAIPGLVVAAAIFLVARALLRLAALLFDRVQSGRIALGGLDAETAAPTRWLFNIVVVLFAVALAYPHLPGANTDAFKGLSVLVGLMVSIGASGLAGQALSGLILMYSRTVRVGDTVRIGDVDGQVKRIGALTTRIGTGVGDDVLLSNAEILQTATRNYSSGAPAGHYMLEAKVTIAYATPWRQVVALLEAAARRTPHIAPTPPPFVHQTALAESHVEYRLVAFVHASAPVPRPAILDRLHANIQDAFNEVGVQIMAPNYEGDPPQPHVVPRERWYASPAVPPDGERGKLAAS